MKLIRKIVVMCVFITSMGAGASLQAAEDAPAAASAPAETSAPAAASAPVAASAPEAREFPYTGGKGGAPMAAKESRERDAVCTRCHDELEATPILAIYQTKHGVRGDARTPNCQTCHGESQKHLKGDPNVKGRAAPDIIFRKGAFEVTDNKIRAGQCLNCHKGTNRSNWDGGQHDNNQMACNDCHKVHAPVDKVRDRKSQTEVCFTCHKEQRADSFKVSTHPIDAKKVVCSDCHNPHGATGPKLLKKATVTETCFTCHAEKRGPLLFEHQPVTEDCTNCHTPHGSNIAPLLKSRAPFLCQECHDGTHASGTPVGPNAAGTQGGLVTTMPNNQKIGAACMNCHRQVHGSNSPAGGYFQR
jgi:DmsE family decaheme c-type cytochrome